MWVALKGRPCVTRDPLLTLQLHIMLYMLRLTYTCLLYLSNISVQCFVLFNGSKSVCSQLPVHLQMINVNIVITNIIF